jgi:hypothetical protein
MSTCYINDMELPAWRLPAIGSSTTCGALWCGENDEEMEQGSLVFFLALCQPTPLTSLPPFCVCSP